MVTSAGAGGISVDDVPVLQVWERLKADPSAVLIDVRTKAEWSFVGVPNLETLGRQPLLVEWQTFPGGQVDPQFAEKLAGQLASVGVGKDREIFFLCRSGGRSKSAATAMAARGFARCRNVAEGFEGPLDAARHRGTAAGWKAAALPWSQT